MKNLRGDNFDGNTLASSGGFVMPNFFFQDPHLTAFCHGLADVPNFCRFLCADEFFQIVSAGQGARDIFSNVRDDAVT